MILDSTLIPATISGSLLKAICHLADAPDDAALMSELASAAGITTAGATGMIDAGEQLGYLMRFRSATDRRKVFVGLTQKGRALVRSMQPTPEARALVAA
jgi:DNA-binding MarR family transcriptional regulator